MPRAALPHDNVAVVVDDDRDGQVGRRDRERTLGAVGEVDLADARIAIAQREPAS